MDKHQIVYMGLVEKLEKQEKLLGQIEECLVTLSNDYRILLDDLIEKNNNIKQMATELRELKNSL